MEHKKTLTGIILASYIAIASSFGFGQQKQHEKLRFSLSQHHKARIHYFQEYHKVKDHPKPGYRILRAPGDNMPIIVPEDLSRYPMPILKSGREWYGDDKFIIKPSPEWRLPEGWLKKDFYKHLPRPHLPGALVYEIKKDNKI